MTATITSITTADTVVTDNDVSGFYAGYELWNDEGGVTIQGGSTTGNVFGIAAIKYHPLFNSTAPDSASDNYVIDGVTFGGNDADVKVNDADVSAAGDPSNFTTFLTLGGGTFDPGTNPAPAQVYGTSLADTVIATAGNQTIDGGDGIDTYDMSAATSSAYVDLKSGVAHSADTGIDLISSFENVRGGAGNDTLNGNDADNVFYASGGNDIINGRGGDDTFDASGASASILVDLQSGSVVGAVQATLTSIENVKTGSGNDFIIVGENTKSVDGGGGNDTVVFSQNYSDLEISGSGSDITVNGVTLQNVETAVILWQDTQQIAKEMSR